MKDTQVKPSPVAVMPKSKLGVKKEKMPAKKVKDPKLSTPKLNKVNTNKVKCVDKKSKIVKDNKEAPVKRKRGRPRKEEKVQIKKKSPEQQKTNKKNCDEKPVGCKRKLPQNNHTRNEKDTIHPPLKKPKITNDVNCNINGNVKIPFSPVHKPHIQKGESPTVIEHIVSNSVNSNGTLHGKKNITLGSKKPLVSSVIRSATFIPPAREEMVNGNSSTKSVKVHPNKNEKTLSKEEAKVNHEPKVNDKDVKSEKPNSSVAAIKEPVKSHPQRMASLDAMAKMHVICAPDRKPVEHHSKTTSIVTVCPPFGHQKSLTCHERIHVDVKKERKDFKGNFVHKQINYVKEKQQVFVSHSVEQSSVLEREQQSKASSKSQNEKEKKKKVKTPNKIGVDNDLGKSVKAKQNPIQLVQPFPKAEKCKSKISKTKDAEKKCAKIQNKAPSKAIKKCIKDKPEMKVNNNKTKKIEQTKSEVKVKETIRMQKTCTYKSVTTVNSHGATNSSVVPVSHVGMTTNTFSKTKKTVVTDEECKNKINYTSGSVINNSYCLTSESPCSVSPHSDCCKFRTHPQIIPIAHVKSCPINHNLNRTSDSSSSSSPSHCDGSFAVHRFSHQQPFIYSSPSSECGCCCSSSLVQNVHDSCLLRKSIVAYPHHLPHHTHLPTSAFTAETLCTDYHSSNATLDTSRHHSQHFSLPSSPHSRVSCCACCDIHRENNQHHHQSSGNCLQCLSSPKNSASLVPCEQSPLDLSLASTSTSNGLDSDLSFQQGHCPSPLCCREVFVLRTSTPHGFQHSKFTPNKPCCRCNKPVACENPNAEAVKQLQCSNKNVIKIGQSHQSVDHLNLLAPTVGQGSVHPVPSTSGLSNKSAPRGVITESFVAAKREKSISPKQPSKVPTVTKKRQFLHGWSWKGKPRERLIALTNDSVPCARICYPSVQHKEGDTINEKDCVLLKSGPKDTDLPYVAKVAAFWENPDDGEMMMSLLWYYRPEHTEQGRKPGQMEDEVFASRHKDVNSVACIEDKCYVLTYNEYCRYRASLTMEDDMFSKSSMLVPELPDGYPRKDRLPSDAVSSDIVFFCRHVYDFRQKRILKNPT